MGFMGTGKWVMYTLQELQKEKRHRKGKRASVNSNDLKLSKFEERYESTNPNA